MPRLHIAAPSRAYDVLVERGALDGLAAELTVLGTRGKVVVCSDANVAPLYLERLSAGLTEAGFDASHLVIPAGEAQKTLARVEEVYGVLYERGVVRGDTLVALGGGVVGDLFGFAAATYLRGLRLVQAPTTLLAQVDAAVGGKTGVDFRAGKNHVGAFYQAWLVVADLDTLRTLPEREVRGGSAEVAKYGLLAGGSLLEEIEAAAGVAGAPVPAPAAPRGTAQTPGGLVVERVTEALVAGCVAEKIAVVEADEREETGRRAVLNLGHTIGHAVEAAGGFERFTHGEAVALGLHAALRLSVALCGLSEFEATRGAALLDALALPRRAPGLDPGAVVDLVR
ncbi:MAG: 3-dehydroquinate synthase, partial [Thermoleophilia bacterium]|nr:3-dehydroquinate synthase [Thermoleophilia bacterium]